MARDINKVIKQEIRQALRQVWIKYSPERREVLMESRVVRPRIKKDGSISKKPDVYNRCRLCLAEVKKIEVDHDEPVGSTPDFPPKPNSPDWSNWILKLFCKKENLRAVCKLCHKEKSKGERK